MCHAITLEYAHDGNLCFGFVDACRGVRLVRDRLGVRPARSRTGMVRFDFWSASARAAVPLGIDVLPDSAASSMLEPRRVAFRPQDIVFASDTCVSVSRVFPIGSAIERAAPAQHVIHVWSIAARGEYLLCWKKLLAASNELLTPVYGARLACRKTERGITVYEPEPRTQGLIVNLRGLGSWRLNIRAGLHVYPDEPVCHAGFVVVPAIVNVRDVLFATRDDISVSAYTIPLPRVAEEFGYCLEEYYERLYERIARIAQ